MEITRRQFVQVSAAAALGAAGCTSGCPFGGPAHAFMLFSGLCLYRPESGMLTVGLVEPDMREEQGRPSHVPILMFPPNFVESATAGIPEVPDSSLPEPLRRLGLRLWNLQDYRVRFTSSATGLAVESGNLCPPKSASQQLPLIAQIHDVAPGAQLREDWQTLCWAVLEIPAGELFAPASPRLPGVFKFETQSGTETHRQALTEWTFCHVEAARLIIDLKPLAGKQVPPGTIVVNASGGLPVAGAVLYAPLHGTPHKPGEYPGLPHFGSFYKLFKQGTVTDQALPKKADSIECAIPVVQTRVTELAPNGLLSVFDSKVRMMIDGSAACPPGTP